MFIFGIAKILENLDWHKYIKLDRILKNVIEQVKPLQDVIMHIILNVII